MFPAPGSHVFLPEGNVSRNARAAGGVLTRG
jgi:hypothetical protein